MGYILCTAEKPSVASDIARVIGADKKCNGYYEGNGYRVTWAVGHLVTLAEPEVYGEQYKDRNNTSLLPILPKKWEFSLIKNSESQFYIMKKLMNDEKCDYIIDCGDMGETGHYLQWLIRMYAGCTKHVKRFCATSMTDEAIKEAMNHLRKIEDFEGIIRGALCKAKGDWIIGMSLSRLFSAKYRSNLTVGRVQTPTLYFVVKRWLEVKNFVPIDYFTIEVNFSEDFKAWWLKDTDNKLPAQSIDSEGRLTDEDVAKKIASCIADERVGGGKGKIIKLETKNKSTDRPQLYDITELERDGNRIYGYTASQVLETAQKLYETHKVMTYPRTDSRYITSDLEPYMAVRVSEIAGIEKYKDVAQSLLKAGLNIDKKIVDDKEVTDHHALLVTEKIKGFDFSKLNEIEANILDLVITRMLVSFSPKYLYKETALEVQLSYGGLIVGAKGRIPISQGWKAVDKLMKGKEIEEENDGKEDDTQFFEDLRPGQIVNVSKALAVAKKTTPPKLHTEATLLTAMENAGASITDNEGYRQILKGHGIGTQATRAEIIKKLFEVGYVCNEQKGKINYIVPTKKGYSATKVFPAELLSPTMTAEWETKFAKIADGTLNENVFMQEFEDFMKSTVEKYKNINVEGLDFSNKEELGNCPWCDSMVVTGSFQNADGEKKKTYYCTNKECRFCLFKDDKFFVKRTQKPLSAKHIKTLLQEKALTVQCKNQNDVKYYTQFTIVKQENGYAGWNAEFVNKGTKGGKRKKKALKKW